MKKVELEFNISITVRYFETNTGYVLVSSVTIE